MEKNNFKFIDINGVSVKYLYHYEEEKYFDEFGNPGSKEIIDVEIIEPDYLIGDEYCESKIVEYEKLG